MEFVIQLLILLIAVVCSILFVVPKLLEKLVIEKIKFGHQKLLKETESSLKMQSDILKSSIEAGGVSGQELRKRSIRSVKCLWNEILRIEDEFSSLTGIENITTDEEMNKLVQGKEQSDLYAGLMEFSDLQTILKKAGLTKPQNVTKERIFVSEKLWKHFTAFRNVHGRLGVLVESSITNNKKFDWKNDNLMKDTVEEIISESEWEMIQGMKLSGFNTMVEKIRYEFLKEARATMRGTEEFSEALGEFHSVVVRQERIAQDERAIRKEHGTS